MKLLTAISVLMFALSAFATSQTKTFFYDGTQDTAMMSLRAEKTHTEYRYEQRYTTCFRQETHYETRCQPGPQGRPVCHTIPVTRTVSYPCWQTVSVPYEVHDYFVEATVDLSFAKVATGATPGETIKATLDGDRLSLSAVGSKKFFVMQTKQEIQTQMTGGLKLIDAAYGIELVEAASIVKALEVSNIGIKNDVLSIKMGPIAAQEHLGFSLDIKKNPVLGSSTTLFDRELSANEIMINSQETSSEAQININKLGVELGSGRHTLTAKIFFKHAGELLNGRQFETTSASRTLIYKR